MTITCLYSCELCGLHRVPVEVSVRLNEDVTAHRERSPECHSMVLSELLIPMTGTDRVGGPTIQ